MLIDIYMKFREDSLVFKLQSGHDFVTVSKGNNSKSINARVMVLQTVRQKPRKKKNNIAPNPKWGRHNNARQQSYYNLDLYTFKVNVYVNKGLEHYLMYNGSFFCSLVFFSLVHDFSCNLKSDSSLAFQVEVFMKEKKNKINTHTKKLKKYDPPPLHPSHSHPCHTHTHTNK